jgi:hypothetical protein
MHKLIAALLFATPLAGQSIPFDICAESTTWVRPSLQMQANKIWNDSRYKGFGKDAYAWTHNLLVIGNPRSPKAIVTSTNLSGLWTVKQLWVHQCYLDKQRGDSIEVLSLLHRVKEVRHEGTTYMVVVEPSGNGFQWLFIHRSDFIASVLRFVTPDNKELERWDESDPPDKVNK